MALAFLSVMAAPDPLGTFPVEIAWVHEDGRSAGYLIRAPERWFLRFRLQNWKDLPGYPASSLTRLQEEGVELGEVADCARKELHSPEVTVFVESDDAAKRLGSLFGEAGHADMFGVRDVGDAYAEACLPLFSKWPRGKGGDVAERRTAVEYACTALVQRCRAAEPPFPAGDRGALEDARRLWRTWRAISDEAARLAA